MWQVQNIINVIMKIDEDRNLIQSGYKKAGVRFRDVIDVCRFLCMWCMTLSCDMKFGGCLMNRDSAGRIISLRQNKLCWR